MDSFRRQLKRLRFAGAAAIHVRPSEGLIPIDRLQNGQACSCWMISAELFHAAVVGGRALREGQLTEILVDRLELVTLGKQQFGKLIFLRRPVQLGLPPQ